MHLSGVRNCHLVKLVSEQRTVWVINTHLHHVLVDDVIRRHESFQLLAWIESQPDLDKEKDLIIITGDFNALPDSTTYALYGQFGYTSCHQHIHK